MIDSDLAAEVAEVVEHLNANHDDTVLLLARQLLSRPALVDAELLCVDGAGLAVTVRDADGAVDVVRFGFERRPETLDALRTEMFGLLTRARATAGESVPLTSLEVEMASSARLGTYLMAVSAVQEIAPNLRQITFRGDLGGAAPLGADQYFYVAVSHHDGVAIEPGFEMAGLDRMAPEVRPAAAYYTVRRWRPADGEIDMWFVLHGEGAVSGWARQARPGQTVAVWGPRRSFEPPAGTSEYLLVGDETGLPAIAAILEDLEQSVAVYVVAEVVDADHMIDLPPHPGMSVHWVFRNGDEPGTGTRLVDAVRSAELSTVDLYAYGAAESRVVTGMRAHLRRERHMPASHVRMIGYWRRSVGGH